MCLTSSAVWWTPSWLISTRRQMRPAHGQKYNVPQEESIHETHSCFVSLRHAVVHRLQSKECSERGRRVADGVRQQKQSRRDERIGATAHRHGRRSCCCYAVERVPSGYWNRSAD